MNDVKVNCSDEKLQELMKEIEIYKGNNNNKEIGEVLDDVLVVEANKPLSYIETQELIDMLKRMNSMNKEINKHFLKRLRESRLKDYHTNDKSKKLYSEEPKSLFINGSFNKNNYFGGDDLIRTLFNYYQENPNQRHTNSFVMSDGDVNYQVTASTDYLEFDGYHYVRVFAIGDALDNPLPFSPSFSHNYTVIIDENNINKIDSVFADGINMDEEEYIFMLNFLVHLGFDFNNGVFL